MIKRLQIKLFVWLYYKLQPTTTFWTSDWAQRGLEESTSHNLDVVSLEIGQTFIELYTSARGRQALKNMEVR